MARRTITKAGTGLAAGALLTSGLLGVFMLGSFAGVPVPPFTVFEWLIRVLPGRMVTFGLDLTLRTLEGLGFDIKTTANTAEQVLAVASLFLGGVLVGLLFFVSVRTADRKRVIRYGLGVGGVLGLFSASISLVQGVPTSIAAKVVYVIWVFALFLLWGWGLSRLYLVTFPTVDETRPGTTGTPPQEGLGFGGIPADVQTGPEAPGTAGNGPATAPGTVAPLSAPGTAGNAPVSAPAEARALSRRRFIIQVGGLAATFVVAGAGVAAVLRAQTTPEATGPDTAPIPFPNEGASVQPAPGTRPEYTAVPDHFTVDIDLRSPEIQGATWRLAVDGLVAEPLSLRLDQIKSDYAQSDQFVTLACISNLVGGPLIGTTLWSGASLREVLADAGPAAQARYVRISSADGFDEEVELELVDSDPRIMLAYAWDGEPLTADHGFPLRLFIPDRYGMKQPKWITGISLTADSEPGYWVSRGWDERAEVETTAVIDTVAVKSLVTRGGQAYIPIGGIAYSGAKGISRVEIQIDDAPWEAAELRQPLSELTWVIWRYDWPYAEGRHELAVRAYDGQGRLQDTTERVSGPSAATGVFSEYRDIPPLQP